MNTIQLSLFPESQDFSVLPLNTVIRNHIYENLQYYFNMSLDDCKSVMNDGLMTIIVGFPTINTIKFDKWLEQKNNYSRYNDDGLSMASFIRERSGLKAFQSIQKYFY
jgi:hypothetical protein